MNPLFDEKLNNHSTLLSPNIVTLHLGKIVNEQCVAMAQETLFSSLSLSPSLPLSLPLSLSLSPSLPLSLSLFISLSLYLSAVVYLYRPQKAYPFLTLHFGDVVQILEENAGWYRGFSLHDKHTKGIFPASHVHLKDCDVRNYGYGMYTCVVGWSVVNTVTGRFWLVFQGSMLMWSRATTTHTHS